MRQNDEDDEAAEEEEEAEAEVHTHICNPVRHKLNMPVYPKCTKVSGCNLQNLMFYLLLFTQV